MPTSSHDSPISASASIASSNNLSMYESKKFFVSWNLTTTLCSLYSSSRTSPSFICIKSCFIFECQYLSCAGQALMVKADLVSWCLVPRARARKSRLDKMCWRFRGWLVGFFVSLMEPAILRAFVMGCFTQYLCRS
jgi:hypothetical protein